MLNLLEKVREKYLTSNNPELEKDTLELFEMENEIRELEAIRDMIEKHQGGKAIKKWAIDNIIITMNGLANTDVGDKKRDTLIADLKANLKIFNKLNTKDNLEAFRARLEEYLEN